MPNRRQFIQSGIAVSAASTMGAALSSAGSSPLQEPLRLERFVYDVRFAESHDIGHAIGRTGVPISGFADDLMSLWYDDLDLRWKAAPMAIGGVTLSEALFVLETFAMDRGMRLVYRGDHSAVSNGRVTHRLHGPAGMFSGLEPTPEDSSWVAAIALAMSRCTVSAQRTNLEFVTSETDLSLREVPLCSWIIAPRQAIAATQEG